jgi:hypothetical protein
MNMAKILITIGLILLWIALVVAFFIGEEKLSTPDGEQGNIKSRENYLVKKLNEAAQEKRIGCAAFGLIQNGESVAEYGFGIDKNILKTTVKTDDTLFLLSSLIIDVRTCGVLKLVL